MPEARAPDIARPAVTAGLAVTVLAVMAGLFFIDRWLANTEQQEVRHEASGLAAEGERLLSTGHASEAVTRYGRAHALFRGDRVYALDYARALLDAGDRQRAETVLRDVLDRDSNDAPANLLMARTMLAAGNRAVVSSYYHRAIYGSWPADASANRIKARLELADWLALQHARDELLAELLPLQAVAPRHPELNQRVADLLLTAGSPTRAAMAYRALLKTNPDSAEGWRGLGEAELQGGNYRAAQRILQEAARRNPSDAAIEARVRLVSAVNALDPTPRRLTSQEKFERGRQLVELSAAALRACAGATPPKNVAAMLAQADRAGTQKVKGAISNETSEARLNVAEELWRARAETCRPESKPDDPLQIIMEKLIAQ